MGVFRATDLTSATTYIASMLGFADTQAGSGLVAGVIYQPYYLTMMIIAAVVVWACPQTWDFTRRLTLPRVATVVALLWVSIIALTTQAYNPFIYFIF